MDVLSKMPLDKDKYITQCTNETNMDVVNAILQSADERKKDTSKEKTLQKALSPHYSPSQRTIYMQHKDIQISKILQYSALDHKPTNYMYNEECSVPLQE